MSTEEGVPQQKRARTACFDMSGQVVVVTGGSTGIGRACCEAFVRANARVVYNLDVADHPIDGVVWIKTDVSSVPNIKASFEQVLDAEKGDLDVLVSNAGVWTCGDFEHVSEEEFDRVLGINVKGSFFAIQSAMPALRNSRGTIVIMASDQSIVGKPEQNVYGMTKGAVGQLTKSLAAQYAPLGVRVNAVCPGTIETPLMHNAIAKIAKWKGIPTDGIYESLGSAQPVPRVGKPEEVAQAVLSCCCNEFMAGALVSVDGGYVAV